MKINKLLRDAAFKQGREKKFGKSYQSLSEMPSKERLLKIMKVRK